MSDHPVTVWLPPLMAQECRWKEGADEIEYVRSDKYLTEIARLRAENSDLKDRADGAEASALNCRDCHEKDAQIERQQAVVEAARQLRDVMMVMEDLPYSLAELWVILNDRFLALDGQP